MLDIVLFKIFTKTLPANNYKHKFTNLLFFCEGESKTIISQKHIVYHNLFPHRKLF